MPFISPLPKSEMNIACIEVKLQKLKSKYIHAKTYAISMWKYKTFMYKMDKKK